MTVHTNKHAVIANGTFSYLEQGTIRTWTIPHLQEITDIIDLALSKNCSHVWVTPGSDYGYMERKNLTITADWDLKPGLTKAGFMRTVTGHRMSGNRAMVSVVWPHLTPWAWDPKKLGDITPRTILAALHYLGLALEMPVSHNPGVMGREIIIDLNSQHSRPGWIKSPDDLTMLSLDVGFDLAYVQSGLELVPGETWYLHGWDINSEHLAGASGADLGTGQPIHMKNPTAAARVWDGKKVGYWRLANMQAPQGIDPRYKGQEWVTTPLLKYFYGAGGKGDIVEAHVWEESHRTLDTFATKLWKAREALHWDAKRFPFTKGRELAYFSLKRIATASIGILANPDTAKWKKQWYRPDWRAIAVERGKSTILYKIAQLQREYGVLPVLIVTDEVCYLSREKDPAKVFPNPKATLGRADDLGGYKHEFTLEFTRELAEAFRPGQTPGNIHDFIGELIEKQGVKA